MLSGNMGRVTVVVCALAFVLTAYAQGPTDDIRAVFKTMQGPNTLSNPRSSTTAEGYLRHLSAPRGNSFEPSTAAKSAGTPDAAAKTFMLEHGEAFGIGSPDVSFVTERVRSANAMTYVRLNQTFKGISVYLAQVSAQLKPDNSIVSVLSDILRDAPRLYKGTLSMTPTLDSDAAAARAVTLLTRENPGQTFLTTIPELTIYAPSVLGTTGMVQLAYVLEIRSTGQGPAVGERLLIDAHSGGTLLRIPLIIDAKFRTIYDAEDVPFVEPGILARAEGDAATGDTDTDLAYDFYGDTYDFYFVTHGRDSIDDSGMIMDATVHACQFGCPYNNASWNGFRMHFGTGWVSDDVVGHELTHGVTQHESDLIYFMESGAINESFSDIWGEFVDLVNGEGNDTPEVRWLMGEDLSIGAIRSMKNPPAFACADRYLGPFWINDPNFDGGGVHFNSGVSNKLCYLLADGDVFNGFTVSAMGINAVAELLYECQTNLLTAASDYPDYGDRVLQAADNLGMSNDEITNIHNALLATNIKQFEGEPVRHFRATGKSGDARVALTWENPTDGDFTGVVIRRHPGRFPNSASDGTLVAELTGGEERAIDTPGVGAGGDVYYAIYPKAGSNPINLPLYARATVGVDVDYLTQSFADGTDLAYSQITFIPTGPIPIVGPATDKPEVWFNYTTYAAHAASDSKIGPAFDGTLPVTREDSFLFALGDDGTLSFSPNVPIPFFGQFLSTLTISANGYIAGALDAYDAGISLDTATLEAHYDKPRISFLLSDLDPSSGGEIWGKSMDDRFVITFENVPSFDHDGIGGGLPGHTFTNTVQCELFWGGQIRFTYLNLTAQRAVVGLSDGNGVPFEAEDIFAGNGSPGASETDLTSLPEALPLELQPIPTYFVKPGDIVAFTATVAEGQGPATYSFLPLPGVVDLPSGYTLDSQTGEFVWDTDGIDEGTYGGVLCATDGQLFSCQTVAVVVVDTRKLPEAKNVTLIPLEARDSDNLIASYTYAHPSLPEGPSVLFWFKNNTVIPAYTNQLMVQDEATTTGDVWYFRIMPTTIQVGSLGSEEVYLRGEVVQSDAITILPDLKVDTNGDGKVNSVDLQLVVRGLLGTATGTVDADVNGDGREDASDVQSTINFILTEKH